MIGRARRLRRNTTEAERLLWDALRRDQVGWRFRRLHPIPLYVVDFACVEARLVVEADGGQHGRPGDHNTRDKTLRRGGGGSFGSGTTTFSRTALVSWRQSPLRSVPT